MDFCSQSAWHIDASPDVSPVVGQQWGPAHYLMVQHRSSRWSSTDRLGNAISSARMTSLLLLSIFLLLSSMLFLISSYHTDYAWNPLQKTSNGNSQSLCPFSLQPVIRSAYLRLFLSCDSSKFSSYVAVSSIATKVFITDTASGLRLVSTTFGKTNFMSRSTLTLHAVMLSVQH